MIRKSIAVFLLMISFSCEKDSEVSNCVEKIDPNKVCTQQYDPVCGCNNKTYGNACMATASGIGTFTKGECK